MHVHDIYCGWYSTHHCSFYRDSYFKTPVVVEPKFNVIIAVNGKFGLSRISLDNVDLETASNFITEYASILVDVTILAA